MGCNASPEIIIINNRIPTKSFKPNIRYCKTEEEGKKFKLPKIIKPKINNQQTTNNSLNNIKSHYILKIVFDYLDERRYLQIISKNKKMQNKLDVSIVNYKNYKRIELEIELIKVLKEEKNYFINLNEDKSLYQIYFDDIENISRRNFVTRDETVKKIKVVLNLEIKSFRGLFNECRCIKKIKFTKFSRNNIIDMSNMFYECRNLVDLDLSLVKSDNVTNMWYMFYGCKSLTSLDLSNFNTEKVTNMRGMFWGCYSLSYLDISSFNTDNVINMSGMFYGCASLNQLDIFFFNTDKVTNMWYMFYGCKSLPNIDITYFNTSKVTNMSYMFSHCESLTTIDISKLKTDKVINMSYMFSKCPLLTNLDISNIKVSKYTNINGIFNGCSEILKENIRKQNPDIIKEEEDCKEYYSKSNKY